MYIGLHTGILRITALAWLLLMMFALPGCSHQVLTFFFTGVPEPGQQQNVATENAAMNEERRQVPKLPYFAHGPYGASSCSSCHESRGDSVFDNRVTAAGSIDPQKVSARLLYPLAELCVGCHSDHQPSAANAGGLWQHGPVANQQCTACHSPHKSDRRYMLLANSDAAMCGQCHSDSELRHTPQHTNDPKEECTRCHNPHAGQSRLLLRHEYDERNRFDRS